MFITDFNNNAVQGWGQSANCNCAPGVSIRGGNTGLANPEGIALDPSGNIYVVNRAVGTMTKFPGGASGNIKPSFAIGGLASPICIAVDSAANLYSATIRDHHAEFSPLLRAMAALLGSRLCREPLLHQ